jgi:pullulanase/glycogen debranching enzyme
VSAAFPEYQTKHRSASIRAIRVTTNDLVSYNGKHNESNGDQNRDGAGDNLPWNCGREGPTDNPEIEALRERQIRNAYALTLLSVRVPLLLMGDEVRRTQNGNNNAYCQNNCISWLDWELCCKNLGLHRFVSILIRLRKHFADVGAVRKMLPACEIPRGHLATHSWPLHSRNRPSVGSENSRLQP